MLPQPYTTEWSDISEVDMQWDKLWSTGWIEKNRHICVRLITLFKPLYCQNQEKLVKIPANLKCVATLPCEMSMS